MRRSMRNLESVQRLRRALQTRSTKREWRGSLLCWRRAWQICRNILWSITAYWAVGWPSLEAQWPLRLDMSCFSFAFLSCLFSAHTWWRCWSWLECWVLSLQYTGVSLWGFIINSYFSGRSILPLLAGYINLFCASRIFVCGELTEVFQLPD